MGTVATYRLLIPCLVTIATLNSSYLDCSYLVRATIATRTLATQNLAIQNPKKIEKEKWQGAIVATPTADTSTEGTLSGRLMLPLIFFMLKLIFESIFNWLSLSF